MPLPLESQAAHPLRQRGARMQPACEPMQGRGMGTTRTHSAPCPAWIARNRRAGQESNLRSAACGSSIRKCCLATRLPAHEIGGKRRNRTFTWATMALLLPISDLPAWAGRWLKELQRGPEGISKPLGCQPFKRPRPRSSPKSSRPAEPCDETAERASPRPGRRSRRWEILETARPLEPPAQPEPSPATASAHSTSKPAPWRVTSLSHPSARAPAPPRAAPAVFLPLSSYSTVSRMAFWGKLKQVECQAAWPRFARLFTCRSFKKCKIACIL